MAKPHRKLPAVKKRIKAAEMDIPSESAAQAEAATERMGSGNQPAPAAQESKPRGGGNRAKPYVRNDGVQTRKTTIHLKLSVVERLRERAWRENISQSELVNRLLEAHL